MKLMDIFWKNISGYCVECWLHTLSIKKGRQVMKDGGSNGSNEKWWNSVSISKIPPTGFTNGLEVQEERKAKQVWLLSFMSEQLKGWTCRVRRIKRERNVVLDCQVESSITDPIEDNMAKG